ncbi:MAG: macro domain-containing protein [Clostridia bacterium]
MGKLNLFVGDIVSDKFLAMADVIVNPTNPMMLCGCGVSGAIFAKAGTENLENYTQKEYNISYYDDSRTNEMKPGEVRLTPGFKLNCDILFAQSPNLWHYEPEQYKVAENLLLLTYTNILKFAFQNGYHNILLPALGTGRYAFEHSKTAQPVASLIKSFIADKDMNVHLVIYDEKSAKFYPKTLFDNFGA